MTTTETTYYASVNAYALVGEGNRGYQERRMDETNEDDYYETFESLDAAKAWMDETVADLTSTAGAYQVERKSKGLDTVTFWRGEVYENVVTTDEDGYEDIEYGSESVHSVCTLPDEVRDAAQKAELSYFHFLDFEGDRYCGIEDLLES